MRVCVFVRSEFITVCVCECVHLPACEIGPSASYLAEEN